MELLKEIANIAGKPGLYKIVKPGRSGVIVESLNELKKREMISATSKVSILNEIAVYSQYTKEGNDSKPLSEIFSAIKSTFGDKIEVDTKNATSKELFDFLTQVHPDYDTERVYANDIKKMINWYNIISEYYPEALVEDSKTEEETA